MSTGTRQVISKWSQLIGVHRISWAALVPLMRESHQPAPGDRASGSCASKVASFGSVSRVARKCDIWSSPKVGNPDFYVTIIDCGMFIMNTTFYSFIVWTKHLSVQGGHLGHWFFVGGRQKKKKGCRHTWEQSSAKLPTGYVTLGRCLQLIFLMCANEGIYPCLVGLVCVEWEKVSDNACIPCHLTFSSINAICVFVLFRYTFWTNSL